MRCHFYQLYSSHHFRSLRHHPNPADDSVHIPVTQSQLHHRVHRQICVEIF